MISDKLAQDIVALSEELVSATTPIEFIPGCQILDVADANAYGANNGWLEAFCGRHNRQRCRLYGTVLNPKVGTFVNVLYLPSTKRFLVLSAGNPSGDLLGFLQWRSPWSPSETYTLDDVVELGGWLMRANKDTNDRPDPQPVGVEFWLSGLGDSPTWDTQQATVNQIITGQRVTVAAPGYLTGYRTWIPKINPLIEYEIILVRDPLGAPVVTSVWAGDPGETGWLEFNAGREILQPGKVYDILLVAESVSGPSSWSAPWDYKRSNGDPGEKEIYHQSAGGGNEMRINFTDNDDADRTAQLTALQAGDEVEGGGVSWEILNVDVQADHVRLTVEPSQRIGSEAVYTFQFTSYAPVPIDYVRVVNHYVSDPNVQGLFSQTGQGNIATDENAYGVDIRIQNAYISPDWDFMAFSSVGTSPATTPPGVASPSTDRNFILNGDWSIQQDRSITYPLLGVNSDTDIMDIWKWRHNGSGAFTLQVQPSLNELGGQRFDRLFQALMQTPNGANPDDYAMLTYPVEGYELLKLWNQLDAGANMTLSFWAYFSKTGTFNICIQNRIASWSYIADYTISAADTWEYKQIQIPRRAWIDGFDTDEQVGITVNWVVRSGVNHRAPGTNQWYSNSHFGSPNLNDFTLLNDSMILVGCQLEAGSAATKFENLSPNTHLKKIQRYYETIVPTPTSQFTPVTFSTVYAGTNGNSFISYVTKRAAPTISLSSPNPVRYQEPTAGGLLTPTSTTFSNINLDRSNLSMSGMTSVSNGDAVFVFLDSGWIEINARLL